MKLGAIPGATPDKWAARWRERHPDAALEVRYYDDVGQLERIIEGTVDLGYVRCREGEDLADPAVHRVWLYQEEPVVCAAQDHWIAAAEEAVVWNDIAGETFIEPQDMFMDSSGEVEAVNVDHNDADHHDAGHGDVDHHGTGTGPAAQVADVAATPDPHEPKAGLELAWAERAALEVAASGTGLVILPSSVARMLSRKDVVVRSVEGIPGWNSGLAWLRERDDELIQEFIGITRGRRASSSRTEVPSERSGPSKPATKPGGRGRAQPKRASAGRKPPGQQRSQSTGRRSGAKPRRPR